MHSTKWRIPYAYTAQRNYNIKKHIDFGLYNKVTYEQIHSHMNSMYDYDEPTRMTLLQLNKQLFEEEGIGNNIVENVNDDYSNRDVYIDSNGIPDFSRHRDGSMNFGYTPEEKSHYTSYVPPTEEDIFNETFQSRIPSDVEQFVSDDREESELGYINKYRTSVDYSKLYTDIYSNLSNVKYANQSIDIPFQRRMTIGLNIYDNVYLPGGIVGTYNRNNNTLNSTFASGRYPTASESNWYLGRIIPKKKSTPYSWSTANRLVNTKRTFGYSNSLYTTLISKYGKNKADKILYNARSYNMSPDEIIQQAIIDENRIQKYYKLEEEKFLERKRRIAAGENVASGSAQSGWGSSAPSTLFNGIDNEDAKQQYISKYTPSYPVLSSLVQKGVTEGKGWSAPIVIFDTETTSLKPNRQTVNVAALKVRYNFKTSKWAILDTYERYYYPDFNFGEFKNWNLDDAIDIYNQSESVRIHGLTTEQIRANRRGYGKLIAETFNTKEQKAFINWLTKDSEYPIIVGNNIKFDALAINDAFVKYTGYNPTYLDLMDMAQSTPELISELAADKRLHGKGGLSVQRMYSRLMHDANYVEKHFGGQDVIDEFSIFKVLTDKIRNAHNSSDGWNRLSSVIRENSPVSGKFVQYPWNTVPMELEYNNSDISVEFFEDIGLSSKDAQNIYVKYKLGKYKPGTLGNVILHNLKINKEALVMNVLTRDIHKMTKKQRKEYKKELKRKEFMKLTGDKSVVETMTFDGDTLVSNGFINEDYVDYDESDYERAEFNNVDEKGREHFISWNDRDAELYLDDNDNITLYNAGSYEIDTNDIKKQRKRNKGYAKSVSHALYNAREAEEYNEETSIENFSDKQLLESIVAEMNKYPSYRGKLYVIYTGSEYKIVSDDPVVARQLETGTGALDMLPDEYDGRNTSNKYSKLYTEEDIFDEVRRRIHMKIEVKWQDRINALRMYKKGHVISDERYNDIITEMESYTSDEDKMFYLFTHKLKNVINPPPVKPWWDSLRKLHDEVALGQQERLKFRYKLDKMVDSGQITSDAADNIYRSRYTLGATDIEAENMIAKASFDNNVNKEISKYLSDDEANAAAIREAEVRAASERAAKEKAYEESYLNRRSSDKYTMRSMREGLGDRVDYLINHGKLAKGTADAILSKFDVEVANGTGSMEAFEKALNKATKEIDKNVVSQQKATKAWESMIKPTDFNSVYQAGYAQINGVLGAASGVLPNFMMNPMRRAGAAVINGFEVDRAKYNYYARTAGMIKNNLSVAGAVLGSFVPGLGAIPGMAIGAGIGEIGTSIYNQMMWRKERYFNETGNILQNSLNTVGFLKSISGLDIAFSALTKTVKWATLGFVGMIAKGLHSMQALGTPLGGLTGVGYDKYQQYGRMDRMLGFSTGTINSSIENFALQQRRMYTYGQMDIDRVVAASMLGVFGSVYANGGDVQSNYKKTIETIAGNTRMDDATKMSWAAMIDKTLPQILQVMKDLKVTTLKGLYEQAGVTPIELTNDERVTMRKTSFSYRTALSNMNTAWQRMGSAVWNSGVDRLFERIVTWIDKLAKSAGTWTPHLKGFVDGIEKLIDAISRGDMNEVKEALSGLKDKLIDSFKGLSEPLSRVISGVAVAFMSGMQTLMPYIAGFIQTLIGQISQFNFDKKALQLNTKGYNFPIIRYGAQKGQFQTLTPEGVEDWKGQRKRFFEITEDPNLSTGEKILTLNREGYSKIGNKFKYAHTDDYAPSIAAETASKVIGNEFSEERMKAMFEQMTSFMTEVMKSLGITVTVKDGDNGNTYSLDNGAPVNTNSAKTYVEQMQM